MLEVVAVLVPVLVFIWIVVTVMSLHKRDIYFWGLGSTWTSIVAWPLALVIASLSAWSTPHDPNAPLFQMPVVAGTVLYAVAFCYAIFYNATRSAMLAISTACCNS